MRPPKPRYTHMWDVHLVTKYRICPGITKLLHLSCSQSNWQCLLPFPARNELHPSQGLSFLHSRVSWLQINYLKPFLRPFHTTRDSVSLALYAISLKVHKTYVQFFHRQSQTLCLFLTSNCIIQSLHPLLADGCAWY